MPCTCAVSAGHSLTHDEDCQAKYDPTRVIYNGLSSGEEIESVWSKLMHLWLRCRESSSANRHDELTEHMHYIATESVRLMGCKLRKQYFKATKTLARHQNLLKAYRKVSDVSDSQATLWYQRYRMERDRLRSHPEIDLLEQKRLELVKSNESVQYWISLMRTHDHHNYKTRSTMSEHISQASSKRKVALSAYNALRNELNQTSETLTIEACQQKGILSREYFDRKHPEYSIYKHFDSMQIVHRAQEEIAYTRTEILSLFKYGFDEIERFKSLQAHSVDHKDKSIHLMYTHGLQKACIQLVNWIADLRKVIEVSGMTPPVMPDITVIIPEEANEGPLPGEVPLLDEGAPDWEDSDQEDDIENNDE